MQEYPQITSLKEAKLLLGTENRYGIYQIIDGSSGREYKFMDLNFIERHGYQVKKEDYELIYSDGMYYGDTLDFLELEPELNRKEVAYRIGDQYFSIQVATEGYDYSFYDKEYKLMDGGILDEDCDDRFAFIAGYTSGGAPYGTTWEEIGIDPELPFEEKVERLAESNYSITEEEETNWDDEMPEMLVLPGLFSVCQVEDYSQVDLDADYCFIGKTDEEKSLVCRTGDVPDNTIQQSDGWRAFRIQGVLDFSLIGILAEISGALARYEVGLFAISTFNTDYILVKDKDYKRVVKALTSEAYRIIETE